MDVVDILVKEFPCLALIMFLGAMVIITVIVFYIGYQISVFYSVLKTRLRNIKAKRKIIGGKKNGRRSRFKLSHNRKRD